jgi:hypothetical protein
MVMTHYWQEEQSDLQLHLRLYLEVLRGLCQEEDKVHAMDSLLYLLARISLACRLNVLYDIQVTQASSRPKLFACTIDMASTLPMEPPSILLSIIDGPFECRSWLYHSHARDAQSRIC